MNYHLYAFFSLNRKAYAELTDTVALWNELKIAAMLPGTIVLPYAILGLKGETVFMLWIQGGSAEAIQRVMSSVLKTHLARYLTIEYTLFGLRRPGHSAGEQEIIPEQKRMPYLLVYPFTKTAEWHLLPEERRREMMREHITTARNYGGIRQLLLYAYGIDDHEFVLSYETESLEQFQKLIIGLRKTAVRAYTKYDTPIFTCVYSSFEELKNLL